MDDLRKLLPKHKCDVANARAVVSFGYPAVAPVLTELLEWLQDMNWPVSHPISEFLASIPEPMVPLIWDVLRGDDLIWKRSCILYLIYEMPLNIADKFREELTRLSENPTPTESAEELDEAASDVLQSLWPSK